MSAKKLHTDAAPSAIGPYSQAMVINGMVYTSGQLPLTTEGQFAGDDIETQTHQIMKNIQAILNAAGSSLDHVVKTMCFIADMNEFATFNKIYEQYFNQSMPARSCVEVARLPKDARIEIEVIAFVSESAQDPEFL